MRYAIFLLVLCMISLSGVFAKEPEGANRDILDMTEMQAYDYAFKEFAAGRQGNAEHLLETRLEKFPQERKARFFSATLLRSRFYKREPAVEFAKVQGANANDSYAAVAVAVVLLDAHQDIEANFAKLKKLITDNPKEPLFLWLAGIECREHARNREGIIYYRKLCEQVDPGGVLIHQTFANLLQETSQYEEALKHREIAVKLEPASWSYNGLGNTLKMLNRYEDASGAYAKAAEIDPDDGKNLAQWADNEEKEKKWDAAATKYAAAIDAGYTETWSCLGYARVLVQLGRKAEAISILEKGLKQNPNDYEDIQYYLDALKPGQLKNQTGK